MILTHPSHSVMGVLVYGYMEKVLTLENIKKTAKDIIVEISKSKRKGAAIVAFSGDLGAGKTTLTKEIAQELGIKESVISPTFVIMKIYKTKDKIFKNLVHIDAYRLESSKELLHLGWEELIKNKENFIIVEWPERVPECLTQDVYHVDIEHVDDRTRNIKFYN